MTVLGATASPCKHLADESKAPLRISNLYVDDGAAHARAASGDLAETGLLQSLFERILDLVAASEGEVGGLQDDLRKKCRVPHGGVSWLPLTACA